MGNFFSFWRFKSKIRRYKASATLPSQVTFAAILARTQADTCLRFEQHNYTRETSRLSARQAWSNHSRFCGRWSGFRHSAVERTRLPCASFFRCVRWNSPQQLGPMLGALPISRDQVQTRTQRSVGVTSRMFSTFPDRRIRRSVSPELREFAW